MLHSLLILFSFFSLYAANVIFPTTITPLYSGIPTPVFTLPANGYVFYYVDVPAGAQSFFATLNLPIGVNTDELIFKFRPWVPSPMQLTDASTPNLFNTYEVPTSDAPLYNPVSGRYFLVLYNTLSNPVTSIRVIANVSTCMLATQVGQFCVHSTTAQPLNVGFGLDVSTSMIQEIDKPLWTAPLFVNTTANQALRSVTLSIKFTKEINATFSATTCPDFYLTLGGPASHDSDTVINIRDQGKISCTFNDFQLVNTLFTCTKTLDYPKSGVYYLSAFLPVTGPVFESNMFEVTAEVDLNTNAPSFNLVGLTDGEEFMLNSKTKATVFFFDVPTNNVSPVVSLLGCPVTYDSEQNIDLQMSVTFSGYSFPPATPDVQFLFAEEWESAKPYPYWYLGYLTPGRYYFHITGVGSGAYKVSRHMGETGSMCLGVPQKPKPPHHDDHNSGDEGADAGLVVLYIMASCCFCAACLSLIGVATGLIITYRQALLAKYGELTGKYVAIGEKKNLYDDL